MAASTREVFLLLRARDEASRVVRGFSSQLSRSNEAMRAAALRQQALALQQEVTQRRLQSANLARLATEKRSLAAAEAKKAAEAREVGATDGRIRAINERVKALRAEGAAIDAQVKNLDKGTAAMVAQIREYDRMASELERSDRLHRSVGSAMMSTASALATVGVAFVGVSAVAGAFFVSSFKNWQEYQRQVALTKTQVDGFPASMEQLSDIGLRVANDIAVPFETIQSALYDIFSSSSANLRQAEILLQGFAKAAVAGQTSIQIAGRGTIAILNGLNIPFENVNRVLDVQFELVRKGVGTYEEFAKVFGRIIPAANRSQQSFETVAVMLAFMTRNGQSAAMASTAAARALELFTHPGAVAKLEKMNVKVRDIKGNYLPLIDILKQLRKELLKMPQADRVKTIVEVFKGSGFNIQARRFLEQVVLGAGELEDFESLLMSMQKASGTLEQAYGQMADTAASKTQLLSNKWMVFKVAVGEAVAPVMLQLIDFLGRILDKFNNLSPGQKKMITNFLMIATAATAVIGVILLLLGGLAALGAAIAMAGAEIFIIAGAVAGLITVLGTLAGLFALAWTQSEPFRTALKNMADNAKQLWKQIQVLGERFSKAWREHVQPALDKLIETINTKVIPAFDAFRAQVWDKAYPKIVEALRIIGDIGEGTLKAIGEIIDNYVTPMLAALSEWWDKNKESLQPFIDLLIQVAKWLAIIVAALIAAGLIAALVTLVGVVMTAVNAFMIFVNWLRFVWDTGKRVWGLLKDLWKILSDLGGTIQTFFKDSGSWLIKAGENLILGLAKGISNKVGELKDATVNAIKNGITNFFPHSPAKAGPLAGTGSTYYSGKSLVSMMAQGMMDSLAVLNAASQQVAFAASPMAAVPGATVPLAPITLGAGGVPIVGPAKTNNVTVNVYTNEIDPRTTATELGWELEGRL